MSNNLHVRFLLSKEYEWPSFIKQEPNKNDVGFLTVPAHLVPVEDGSIIKFEELAKHSLDLGGDLNRLHFKYFKGKKFKRVTEQPTNISSGITFIEIEEK